MIESRDPTFLMSFSEHFAGGCRPLFPALPPTKIKSHYVAQVGLELTILFLKPRTGITGLCLHVNSSRFFKKYVLKKACDSYGKRTVKLKYRLRFVDLENLGEKNEWEVLKTLGRLTQSERFIRNFSLCLVAYTLAVTFIVCTLFSGSFCLLVWLGFFVCFGLVFLFF